MLKLHFSYENINITFFLKKIVCLKYLITNEQLYNHSFSSTKFNKNLVITLIHWNSLKKKKNVLFLKSLNSVIIPWAHDEALPFSQLVVVMKSLKNWLNDIAMTHGHLSVTFKSTEWYCFILWSIKIPMASNDQRILGILCKTSSYLDFLNTCNQFPFTLGILVSHDRWLLIWYSLNQ